AGGYKHPSADDRLKSTAGCKSDVTARYPTAQNGTDKKPAHKKTPNSINEVGVLFERRTN
ncbi:hypothetical protein, partial [Pseudomonas viridiflava]|uniref:hypothetical protein n=1 Tax=Pseudomonas viridiflava TaxID=33069 RepID=UPI0019817A6F